MIRTSIPRRRPKPRKGRVKSPEYLAFIHTLRCLLLGHSDTRCSGELNAHHVDPPTEQRNDLRTIPLCKAHHLQSCGPHAIHRLGREQWQAKFGKNLEFEVLRLQTEFNERRAA